MLASALLMQFEYDKKQSSSYACGGMDWAVCNDAVVASSARAVLPFSYSSGFTGLMKVKGYLGEAICNRVSVNNIALIPCDTWLEPEPA